MPDKPKAGGSGLKGSKHDSDNVLCSIESKGKTLINEVLPKRMRNISNFLLNEAVSTCVGTKQHQENKKVVKKKPTKVVKKKPTKVVKKKQTKVTQKKQTRLKQTKNKPELPNSKGKKNPPSDPLEGVVLDWSEDDGSPEGEAGGGSALDWSEDDSPEDKAVGGTAIDWPKDDDSHEDRAGEGSASDESADSSEIGTPKFADEKSSSSSSSSSEIVELEREESKDAVDKNVLSEKVFKLMIKVRCFLELAIDDIEEVTLFLTRLMSEASNNSEMTEDLLNNLHYLKDVFNKDLDDLEADIDALEYQVRKEMTELDRRTLRSLLWTCQTLLRKYLGMKLDCDSCLGGENQTNAMFS